MRKKNVPYDMLLILYGMVSILLCYAHAFPMVFDILFIPIGMMAIFLGLTWIFVNGKRKVFYVFLIILVLMLVLTRNVMIQGFQNLYNQMVDVYANSDAYYFQKYDLDIYTDYHMSTQWCILLIFTIYMIASCITIFEHKGYLLNFVLSFVMFIPTIMYRVPQNFIIDSFLFIYWILLFFHHTMQKKGISIHLQKSYILRIFLVLVVSVFSFQWIYPQSKFVKNVQIEKAREDLETTYRQKIQKALSDKTGEVNLNNAKDRFYFDTVQMKMYSEQPMDYYIKTFSGSRYEDNTWKLLDDNQYHEQEMNWIHTFMWYRFMHVIDPTTQQENMYQIRIEDKRAGNDYAPVPYNLAIQPDGFTTQYDAYVKGKKKDYEYDIWKFTNMYSQRNISTNYLEFINAYYKEIPTEITRYFQDQQLYNQLQGNNMDEVISNIQEYLSNQASYTLKPGATPAGEDFVTYFLHTNKKGYCVHFASAATLMFHYMGIPARYVEGFHVNEAQFNSDDEATITDRQAHAWVEIFDEQHGWIPVEVTPGTTQTNETTNQNNEKEENNQQTTQNQKEEDQQQTKDEEPKQDVNKETSTQTLDVNWNVILSIAGIVSIAILILLIHHIRYHKWMKAMTQSNYKEAIKACDAYYQKWIPYGLQISSLSKTLIDKARYSQHELTKKEYQMVYHEIQKGVSKVYKAQTCYTKLYLIFVKAIK